MAHICAVLEWVPAKAATVVGGQHNFRAFLTKFAGSVIGHRRQISLLP